VLGRRLLVIVAVLLGLAAVTASLAPPQASRSTVESSARSGPGTSQPELEPRVSNGRSTVKTTADVPFEPSLTELDAQRSRQRVEVQAGRRVRLSIKSRGLGSVQIGADGPIEAIDPDSPARFDLLYESPRELAIRVRDGAGGPARAIGRLTVVPAP